MLVDLIVVTVFTYQNFPQFAFEKTIFANYFISQSKQQMNWGHAGMYVYGDRCTFYLDIGSKVELKI